MRKPFIFTLFSLLCILYMSNANADVYYAKYKDGLIVTPSFGSSHTLVKQKGPGKFISARIAKQGGSNDITFVNLEIDGQSVVNRSFAALRNFSLTENNPYGVVILGKDLKSVTIGFPFPLVFEKSLSLSVFVNETGVSQIIGTVIHGK